MCYVSNTDLYQVFTVAGQVYNTIERLFNF